MALILIAAGCCLRLRCGMLSAAIGGEVSATQDSKPQMRQLGSRCVSYSKQLTAHLLPLSLSLPFSDCLNYTDIDIGPQARQLAKSREACNQVNYAAHWPKSSTAEVAAAASTLAGNI